MKPTRALRTLAAIAALSLSFACVPGGGGGGGGGGNDGDGGVRNPPPPTGNGAVDFDRIGVDEDDTVADLEPDQIQAVCDALEAEFADALSEDELIEFACATQALFLGLFAMDDPVAACEAGYEACLDNPEEVMFEDEDEPCPLTEHPECTATLGDIRTCIGDALEGLREFNQSFDCDLLEDLMENPPMEAESTPACQAVEDACPGLLDDDDVPEPEPEPMDGAGP